MPTKTFAKEVLKECLWGDSDTLTRVHTELVDTGRWSTHHYMVFSFEGQLYGVSYSQGATECQDESPFEYEPEEIACNEVEAVQQTVTVYQPVKGTN